MRNLRWLAAMACVPVALLFVMLWAAYQSDVLDFGLPFMASDLPLPPLGMAGGTFLLAFLLYPWGPEKREPPQKPPGEPPPQ